MPPSERDTNAANAVDTDNRASAASGMIRLAVVGAGWIAQEAFLPAVHNVSNATVTAIVSGNRDKAQRLADFHGVPHVYDYTEYDRMLADGVVDAVYIALPNSMHAEYAIKASEAGIHALVEKPLAVDAAECDAMIAAARDNGVWLMTAYRLHSEPGTVDLLRRVYEGEIGDPRLFSAQFSFQSGEDNHRLLAEHWGGALQDVGVYCINAARHVFRDEPVEVVALADSGEHDARFAEVPEAVGALLRFPGGRMAHFFASFGCADNDAWRVHGTTGTIEASSGFLFQTGRRATISTTGDAGVRTDTPDYPQDVDDFSGQVAYFADCILSNSRPEPDGEDGRADVVIMRAIEAAVATGRSQPIELPARQGHPSQETMRAVPRTDRRLVL